MKQMIDIELFDNDERILINKGCENVPITNFTRTGFLSNLSFSQSISTDPDVIALLDRLIEKISRMSDDEWENMKAKIPFEVYYDAEDNEN